MDLFKSAKIGTFNVKSTRKNWHVKSQQKVLAKIGTLNLQKLAR